MRKAGQVLIFVLTDSLILGSKMNKITCFLKNEIVLVVSFILAVGSMFFVSPSKDYFDYIDFRTLALLFSLMVIMAGLNGIGLFSNLARSMLKRVKRFSGIALVFVILCFFLSMLVTNDVALLTFVPFTIVTLKMAKGERKIIYIVILETVAANLGSMVTPTGNPQNLYLFSAYHMHIGEFLKTILPYGALSLVCLVICCFLTGKSKITVDKNSIAKKQIDKKLLVVYLVLFLIAVLCVLRVIHYLVILAAVIIVVLIADRHTLKKADFSLIFTFVFLFIFIGNLGNIQVVDEFLRNVVTGNEVLAGIVSSQFISNVPAAVLLSGFTDNANALLIGVNIGGLGTLIASMASLISFKFIQKENVSTVKYLLLFTLVNIIFLVVNIGLWILIS